MARVQIRDLAEEREIDAEDLRRMFGGLTTVNRRRQIPGDMFHGGRRIPGDMFHGGRQIPGDMFHGGRNVK